MPKCGLEQKLPLLKAQLARLVTPAHASSPGCVHGQGSHSSFKRLSVPLAEEVSECALSLCSSGSPELEHIHGRCRQQSPWTEESGWVFPILQECFNPFGHCTIKSGVNLFGAPAEPILQVFRLTSSSVSNLVGLRCQDISCTRHKLNKCSQNHNLHSDV